MNDNIQSITHITRNEDGLEQVTIVYKQTLVSRLLHRQHTHSFVKKRLVGWRHKVTGLEPSLNQFYIIAEATCAFEC